MECLTKIIYSSSHGTMHNLRLQIKRLERLFT
jgi:hypothetical protein